VKDIGVQDITVKEGYLDSGHNRGRKDIWIQDITVEGRMSGFRK